MKAISQEMEMLQSKCFWAYIYPNDVIASYVYKMILLAFAYAILAFYLGLLSFNFHLMLRMSIVRPKQCSHLSLSFLVIKSLISQVWLA